MDRKRAWIWLILGAALSLAAGFFTYRTVSVVQGVALSKPNMSSVAVIVLTHDVSARSLLKNEDITIKEVPSDVVPKDAVKSKKEAVGKITRVPLVAGEVLVSDWLVSPTATGKDVAFTMPEGYVVTAIPAADLISRSDILQPGDKIDIMVSLSRGNMSSETDMVTLDALQNVTIQGILVERISNMGSSSTAEGSKGQKSAELAPPEGLLVAVSPQDALVLKFFKDSGGMFDIAIRAPTNKKASEVEPVDWKYLSDKYQIEMPQSSQVISGAILPNGSTASPNSKNGGK